MTQIWTIWFLTLFISPVLMSVEARHFSTFGPQLQLSPAGFMSVLAWADVVRPYTSANPFARVAYDQASPAEPQSEMLDEWGEESVPHARMGADNLDLRSIIEVKY
jgi:hypothetical protein